MSDFLPIIVVGFAASIGLTPLTRQLARRIGLVATPNARRIHRAPIPLMGGLAIYGAFMLALLMFSQWPYHLIEMGSIALSATLLAGVGFLDDRLELSPKTKLIAEFIAAGAVMLAGIRIELFDSVILDVLLTAFWIVGIINAMNFMDNMDGLAAGVSAIASVFLFILSASQGQELVSSLSAALCGAAVGFLIYNFNPATTFMGDMGSLVLGFVVAVLAIKLRFPATHGPVSWFIPMLVLALPIFDTTLVVFTRFREGRSPLDGGTDHTSHRLVAMGVSHRMAVLTLYALCVLAGLAALVISQAPVRLGAYTGLGAAIVGAGMFIILEITRFKQRRKLKAQEHIQPS